MVDQERGLYRRIVPKPVRALATYLLSRLHRLRDIQNAKQAHQIAFARQQAWQRHLDEVTLVVKKQSGMVVMEGPFAGMRYVEEAFCSGYTTKLLGCYEAELHGVLERIFARSYDSIVDIGAGEGYYVVGMARRFPGTPVIAFELEAKGRELCEKMARLNGVEGQVQVRGGCEVSELEGLDLRNALVICDCEGYEIELLQPDLIPALRQCVLLVELHDGHNPAVTATVLPRFQATHDITLVDSAPHDPAQFPVANFLPPEDRALAVDDLRGYPMQWAFMTPKAG